MKVQGNLVVYEQPSERITYKPTDNASGTVKPLFLVMHYTAGISLDSAVSWFLNPEAKASAHFVVDRDGGIVQMVELDKRAWHAGQSVWGSLQGLNQFSIGIELVNAGKLAKRADGAWVNWSNAVIQNDDVLEAIHKNEKTVAGWQMYPGAQIEAAIQLGVALHKVLQFQDVLGHDDIAPGRKTDPGPAFNMNHFRSAVLGR